jgi:hypothetical protein
MLFAYLLSPFSYPQQFIRRAPGARFNTRAIRYAKRVLAGTLGGVQRICAFHQDFRIFAMRRMTPTPTLVDDQIAPFDEISSEMISTTLAATMATSRAWPRATARS